MGSKTINQITETQTIINDTDSIELQEYAGTSKKTTFAYIKTWILTWIYKYIYPVGFTYVQYPDTASNDEATAFPTSARPATMFGGTWVEQFNTEGCVFQTAGYDGLGRTNGLMADQFETHIHPASVSDGGTSGSGAYIQKTTAFAGVNSAGVTIGAPSTGRSGTRTSHTNRLAKYWKRTVL